MDPASVAISLDTDSGGEAAPGEPVGVFRPWADHVLRQMMAPKGPYQRSLLCEPCN